MSSAIPRFYRLDMAERRRKLASLAQLGDADIARMSPDGGLGEAAADRMVENAIGVFGLPLGLCVNLRVNDEDVLLPMVVEEPSVVAACSYAAKLLRAGGGVTAETSEPLLVGQIQVLDVPDAAAAEAAIRADADALIATASSGHRRLAAAGGGARAIEVRHLSADGADPCGDMLVVHLLVDVRDAMGANAVNSMCERIAPRIAELSGGRVGLRILSNLTDQRTVTVTGRVPYALLDGKGTVSGEELAKRIEEASVFAERDPYRACTHNKGIMNGIDAALIALGQDWRAVEAGAHAYAARDGQYGAMATWRAEDGYLVGRMTIPLAVGTVGGIAAVHPVVGVNRRVAGIKSADALAGACAAAGLAQNLGALRALAAEGIQSGHMRLHARNVAVEAGAEDHEVAEIARRIADAKTVNQTAAVAALAELRGESIAPPAPEAAPAPRRRARPPLPPPSTWAASAIDHVSEDRDMKNQNNETPELELTGRVLVTGAAGHLGANLVRRLLDDDLEVRVLLRDGSDNSAVDGLKVERVLGDLRDAESVARAVDGCQAVFHCAARVSTLEPTPEIEREVYECNVLGTKNLLRCAREAGVEKVVVTGSFSAVGYDLDEPERAGNEDMPFWPFETVFPYARTKVLVEHEALKACVEGLNVVIATSCAILGPNDYKPSRMGRLLIDFAHGRVPAYIPGGFDFVATRDICEGHMLAMKRGRMGQKYIISSSYLEVDEVMAMYEEVSGHARPKFRLPGAVMAPIAEVTSFVMGTFMPKRPQRLTPGAVRILRKRRRADTSKAQRELGFRPTSVRDAIHEAYADFARRGLVPARPGLDAVAKPARAAVSSAETSSPRPRAATGS